MKCNPIKKLKNCAKISSYQFGTSVGRPTDVCLQTKFFLRGLKNL